MGVSLERVQFKFASIIGELCSDPDTLSQFAVWLDLRLAEYKLKGAISLDCSGEEPNPFWLKGINKQSKSNQQASSSHRSASSHSPSRSPFHRPQSASNTDIPDRLSPDVLVVKDEPQEVYPVQMHTHRNTDSSFTGRRKRSAAETMSSESWSQDIQPSPSPKHLRMSSAVDSPSNQSLMSVIGGFEDTIQQSEAQGDNSALTDVSASCSRTPVSVQELTAEFTDTINGADGSQTSQNSNLHYKSRLGNESIGSTNAWRQSLTTLFTPGDSPKPSLWTDNCQPTEPFGQSKHTCQQPEPSGESKHTCQPSEPSGESKHTCQPSEPSGESKHTCQPSEPSGESKHTCQRSGESKHTCQPSEPSEESKLACQRSGESKHTCQPSEQSGESKHTCQPTEQCALSIDAMPSAETFFGRIQAENILPLVNSKQALSTETKSLSTSAVNTELSQLASPTASPKTTSAAQPITPLSLPSALAKPNVISALLHFDVDREQINIGCHCNPVYADILQLQKIRGKPCAKKYILAAMEIAFSTKELENSSLEGGQVKYSGQIVHKRRLCQQKLSAIYQQAAILYSVNEDELRNSRDIRNSINSKCRSKRLASLKRV